MSFTLLSEILMAKERSDKVKNKAKVLSVMISDPFATEREIAERAWVSKTSAHNHIEDIDQNWPNLDWKKIEFIERIISTDAEIVELAQAELKKRIQETPDKVSTKDIISSADTSAKRYSLFKWSVTDDKWWLKEQAVNINLLSNDELLKIALWK